jgi:hypothetical protein
MTQARAVAVSAGAALAAIAAAGCGAGDENVRRPATTARPAPAARVTIDEPADGQALRGRAGSDGRLRLRTRVRGRARPGQVVYVSASCRPRPCEARAVAGAPGRWSAPIVLTTTPAARFVTIDAGARKGVVGAGSAVATVELVGARRARRAVARDGDRAAARRRGARPDDGAPQRTSRPALPRDVLVIGDSLAEGMADGLKAALPGWRVRVDAEIGRPLADGMRILAAQRAAPAILAFSLFTNDDPRNQRTLEAAVRASASRAGGCAVWATIVAPPVKGLGFGAVNDMLRGLAGDPDLALSLQLVDWSAAVARSPSLLAGDGVHATPAGYGARAELYAGAIRACAGVR